MTALFDLAIIVFYVLLFINLLILVIKLWDSIKNKTNYFKNLKSAYSAFSSLVFCLGKPVGVLIVYTLSLLVVTHSLNVNYNVFVKDLESQNTGTHYYTAMVDDNNDKYYFIAEVSVDVQEYETSEGDVTVRTFFLTKILCSENTFLIPENEPVEIDVGKESNLSFIDTVGQELDLNVTVLNHPSFLEHNSHNIWIDIQAIYLLICLYAIAVSPKKALS